MKDHIHKFSFISFGLEKSEMRFKPFIQLVLENWTRTEGGLITVVPNLMTAREIDANVHELKKDLDRVAVMAKLELEKLNGRISN